MATKSNELKVLPLTTFITQKCGVCDGMLVIPPVYSCKSASFICGPCFEGKRYYLDDDDIRATDNPIRQILYENYAREVSFPCSFHPFCKGQMHFDGEAKTHYKDNCFAKVLWIFKCPISASNRWYLKPDQSYCSWKYKREILYEDENKKLTEHLKKDHSEYILERPFVLNLQDLKKSSRQRQLFLLLIEENSLVAAVTTDVTETEVIFRCRVNDAVDDLTLKADPYECSVTLVPPNERFNSMVDLKFECVLFDSEDVEYPWHSLRLPIRHLVEETSFKLMVLPRSFMLRSIPYLHRGRQLYEGVDEMLSESTLTASETGRTVSEDTISVVESNKTEVELFTSPRHSDGGFGSTEKEDKTDSNPESRQFQLAKQKATRTLLSHDENRNPLCDFFPDIAPLKDTPREFQSNDPKIPFITSEDTSQSSEDRVDLTSSKNKDYVEQKDLLSSKDPSSTTEDVSIEKTKKKEIDSQKYSPTQDLLFSSKNENNNSQSDSSTTECPNTVTASQPLTYSLSKKFKNKENKNVSLSTDESSPAQEIVNGRNEQTNGIGTGIEEHQFRNGNIVSQTQSDQSIAEKPKEYAIEPNLRDL